MATALLNVVFWDKIFITLAFFEKSWLLSILFIRNQVGVPLPGRKKWKVNICVTCHKWPDSKIPKENC